MTTTAAGVPAPELLEARFAACVAAGDLDGMLRLYAADAVVSLPRGREAAGHAAIRSAFAAALGAGALGAGGPGRAVDHASEQATLGRAARAVVSGDLAMTTSTTAEGDVLTQVARRQADGSWVWVRDGSRLRDVPAALAGPVGASPEGAVGAACPVDRPGVASRSEREFGGRAAVA